VKTGIEKVLERVQVKTPEEIADCGAVIVCMRVSSGPPAVLSGKSICGRCGEEVWISPSTQEVIHVGAGNPVACLQCVMKELGVELAQ